MKAKYKYKDSKKGKATVFPSLGVMTIGCGGKKDSVNGKYAIIFTKKSLKEMTGMSLDIYG